MRRFKELLLLFLTMFKVGLFTFGGGYAMLAILQNEFVEKKKWIVEDDFYNVIAIAESTPGPIAINMATYIGYKLYGLLGSIIATLGIVIPSFTIIFIISLFFDEFLSLTLVTYAFKGIQVAVCYLIFTAGIKMLKKLDKHVVTYILVSLTGIVYIAFTLFSVKFSSIYYILIGAITTLTIYSITTAVKKREKLK